MATIVLVLGGLTAAFSILGAINPDAVKRFTANLRNRAGWYLAVLSRLVFGVVLILAGPLCRPNAPWIGWTVRGIGSLAILVAIVVLLLGEAKYLAMLDWSLRRPLTAWRGMMLVTLLIGGFLIYAGT